MLLGHGVAQLAAELGDVHAVFGGFSRAQENNRDVVVVAGAKFGVFVNVDFGKARAELFQQGSDLRLGLLAEVAAGARVEGDVARGGELQTAVFGARVGARRPRGAQPSSLDELQHDSVHNRGVSQIGERSRARAGSIESGKYFLFLRI